MKSIFRWSTGLMIIYLCPLTLNSCKKEQAIEQTVRVEKLLTENTWSLQSVDVDGTDQTDIYSGLSITFTSSGYTTEGGKEIWPSTDSWSFTDKTGTSFVRGDGLVVTIAEISQTTLVLELSWSKTTFVGGRIKSISGKHSFKFKK